MPLLLLVIFIGIPVLEIAVFIEAGSLIGLWPTIAIVVVTAFVGTSLLRIQGYGVINRIRAQTEQGQVPVFELFEGLCLFAAGLLLLTPGFVTDTVGFLLFLPPLRRLFARLIAARIAMFGFQTVRPGPPPGAGPASASGNGPVIDGEFTTVDRDTPPST